MNALRHMPPTKRPRERLREEGVEALQLEELLALLLRTGIHGNDVLSLSHQVAQYLVSGKVNFAGLASIPGVGFAKAAEVMAALQLGPALRQRSVSPIFSDPSIIYGRCQDLLDQPQENLVVFYLTVRNQQIARDTVSLGTATASLVHPREVFRPAILHNASHVVLAHNHPSGDPSPSQADREVTSRIARAGGELGIELLDHVICARDSYRSLRAEAPGLFILEKGINLC